MSGVAIVVPVYRPTVPPLERLALRRCQRVLAAYPRILVCPEGLDVAPYHELFRDVEVHRFPAQYFTSERAYSRMLRLPDFYARFLNFEHILVYQPDAYVFTDELTAFCAEPCDYIGAPWLGFDGLAARRTWVRFVVGLPRVMNPVGNGGLSLRRTAVMHEVARRFRRLGERLDLNEDLYFTSLLARLDRRLRVADFATALRFAFEFQPRRCFELNGNALPFGCHAFARYDFDFWRQHIPDEELVEAGVTARSGA